MTGFEISVKKTYGGECLNLCSKRTSPWCLFKHTSVKECDWLKMDIVSGHFYAIRHIYGELLEAHEEKEQAF